MAKPIQKLAGTLASAELWVIAPAVLLTFLTPAALPAVLLLGLLFWLIRRIATGSFTIRTPLDISILLLALLLPLNLWVSPLPATTLIPLLRLLTGILLFYAIVNAARTASRLRLLVYAASLASLLLALFALVSVKWSAASLFFIPAAIYNRFILLVSDTVQHNVMAGSLVILLPISMGILLFAWNELRLAHRLLLAVATSIVFLILGLTQSRGAILALGVILLLLIALRWRWGWATIPLALAAVAATVAYLGIDRVLTLVASGVSLEGLQGRLEVWSRALYIIQDFPLTGIGMGMFGTVADNLYPFFLNAPGSVPHAHNLFLQVAVDLGIPGLIVWLSILVMVIVMCLQLFSYGRRRSDHWTMGLAAGLLASQAGLIVHGLLDSATWGAVRAAPIPWAIWGLAATAWIHSRRRSA